MIKQTSSLICALWLVLAAAFPANAQTMSYADAIFQLATACRNDIAKYCMGVPLGPRLKTCFDTNEARMSPQCQQTRGIVYASISRRAAAQRNIGDICSADITRLCVPRVPARTSSSVCSARRPRR